MAGNGHDLSEGFDESTHDLPGADPLGVVWRAVEAACGASVEERAVALVALARDLRRIGEARLALSVLDIAWSLEPSPETTCSAYACAIDLHCDLGQHERARSIEREQARRAINDDFARAGRRLYDALAAAGDVDARAFAQMYAAVLVGTPEFPTVL